MEKILTLDDLINELFKPIEYVSPEKNFDYNKSLK